MRCNTRRLLFPYAIVYLSIDLRQSLQAGKNQCHCMLCNAPGIHPRIDIHWNLALLDCFQIQHFRADASTLNHFEPRGGIQYGFINPKTTAYQEIIRIAGLSPERLRGRRNKRLDRESFGNSIPKNVPRDSRITICMKNLCQILNLSKITEPRTNQSNWIRSQLHHKRLPCAESSPPKPYAAPLHSFPSSPSRHRRWYA